MKKIYARILIKWGAVLGVAMSALELIKMVARTVQYGNTKVLDIAMIIGYVLILYAGIKELKHNYASRLTFAKAYGGTVVISFVGALILFGYCMLHYAVIEPDGLNKKYESALDNFKQVIYNDTITTAELTAYLDTTKQLIAVQEKKVCADITEDSIYTDIHNGADMIYKYYAEKVSGQQAMDTADNYRMRNFCGFARKKLVETLELYMIQNEQQVSTPYIKQIVQQANNELLKVSPAEIRYEKNKSHVPHYDKTGMFAMVNALITWLYGMFFGLFIAMYHYTSKKTLAEQTYPHPDGSEEQPADEVECVEVNEDNNQKNN